MKGPQEKEKDQNIAEAFLNKTLTAGVISGDLKAVIASMPIAMAVYDKNAEIIISSEAAEAIFSRFNISLEYFNKPVCRALKGETVNNFEMTVIAHDGGEVSLSINCVPMFTDEGKIACTIATFLEITEYKTKEQTIIKLNKTLKALSRSSQAMMRAVDEKEYLNEVCRIIVEDCSYSMVWIGYSMEDEGKSVVPVAFSGMEEGYLEQLNVTWADTERGRGPTGTAVRTGKISWCSDMKTNQAFKPWKEEALKRGYASSIAFPLLTGDKSFGALTIYSDIINSFTSDEMDLLAELASDLSFGITSLRVKAAQFKIEERLFYQAGIINNVHDAIISLDPDLNIMEWNNAAEQLYGWKSWEAIGRHMKDVVKTEISEEARKRLLKIAVNKGSMITEAVHHNRDGRAIFVESNLSIIYDLEGKITGYLTVNRDITERKKAEDRQAYLASFPAQNPNPIFEISLDGNILYENDAALKILNTESKTGVKEIFPGIDNSLIEAVITNKIIRRETEINGKWYRQAIQYFETIPNIRIYMVDITDRVIMERELEKAKNDAENANEAKSRFLATLAMN